MFINIGHGWEPCSPPGFGIVHRRSGDSIKKEKFVSDVRQLKRFSLARKWKIKLYSVVLPFRDRMEFY